MKTVVTSFLIVLFLGLTSTAMAYSIRDDATGGDCTQIGIWDGATKTCTLTRDLYNIYDMGISADSDGITICGDGHTISGIGIYPSYGVYLVGRSGVTVNNLKIENFTWGIVSGRSVRNTIDNNVVSNCDYGITSSQSTGDIIINNAVTAYIEIPEHDLNQIDISTIKLSTANGSVSAQLSPAEISDYDSDGMPDLMVKFDRQEVIGIVDTGDAVEIKVSGTIAQRTFKESDTIRVIE